MELCLPNNSRYRTEGARRARRYGTNAVLQIAIGIGILVLLAVLSTRYHVRWDWTEASVHSLSNQSVKVLAGEQAVSTAWPSEGRNLYRWSGQ